MQRGKKLLIGETQQVSLHCEGLRLFHLADAPSTAGLRIVWLSECS